MFQKLHLLVLIIQPEDWGGDSFISVFDVIIIGGIIWFFTSSQSDKRSERNENKQVNYDDSYFPDDAYTGSSKQVNTRKYKDSDYYNTFWGKREPEYYFLDDRINKYRDPLRPTFTSFKIKNPSPSLNKLDIEVNRRIGYSIRGETLVVSLPFLFSYIRVRELSQSYGWQSEMPYKVQRLEDGELWAVRDFSGITEKKIDRILLLGTNSGFKPSSVMLVSISLDLNLRFQLATLDYSVLNAPKDFYAIELKTEYYLDEVITDKNSSIEPWSNQEKPDVFFNDGFTVVKMFIDGSRSKACYLKYNQETQDKSWISYRKGDSVGWLSAKNKWAKALDLLIIELQEDDLTIVEEQDVTYYTFGNIAKELLGLTVLSLHDSSAKVSVTYSTKIGLEVTEEAWMNSVNLPSEYLLTKEIHLNRLPIDKETIKSMPFDNGTWRWVNIDLSSIC